MKKKLLVALMHFAMRLTIVQIILVSSMLSASATDLRGQEVLLQTTVIKGVVIAARRKEVNLKEKHTLQLTQSSIINGDSIMLQ